MNGFGGVQYGHFIKNKDPAEILKQFAALGIAEGHFTNGTFTLLPEQFTPLMLAAQKRVLDLENDKSTPLITAINSDVSMLDSYKGKEDEIELSAKLIPQETRAENVAAGLARMFPGHPVVVMMYDEQTPFELYRSLSEAGFGMKSLYKLGFGTDANAKPIIGAEFFDKVYAFPMPFDAKPVMYADTRNGAATDRQPDIIEKLTEVCGDHGKPYITKEGKLLFPVPAILSKYAAPDVSGPVSGYHLKR